MKKIHRHMVILSISTCQTLLSQNLITNPGFESGTSGWETLWTRAAGAGTSEIVESPVHSGGKALRVRHWGREDWSIGPQKRFAVKTGQIYDFSAWVRTDRLKGSAELCITTMDAGQNAIDWAFQTQPVGPPGESFTQYSIRFAVPVDAEMVWPRFVGTDSCDIVIDDVEFVRRDSLESGPLKTLENGFLKAVIRAGDFSMTVFDKKANTTYSVLPVQLFRTYGIDSAENRFTFHCSYVPEAFDMTVIVELEENTLTFHLEADSAQTLSRAFGFPGLIPSRSSDFLIIPYAAGMILPVTEVYPFDSFPMWGYKATMPFAGVTDLATGTLITSDDPWDSEIRFENPAKSSLKSLRLMHHPSKKKFGTNRTFHVTFIETGGYVEMARWYRAHAEKAGFVKTFERKIRENPNVDKLRGAVDFWALEAPFKTPAFIDSLAAFGVDRAILSLGGGWANNEKLDAVIRRINEKGMLSSRYDIYTDVWPPTHPEESGYRTEGYPQDVVVDADGSLHKGWLAYLEPGHVPFQGYYTCAATHADYARRWVADDLAKNPYNCRFIDVELASSLSECFSPVHPADRRHDALNRAGLLDAVKNGFNLVTGDEEARDWAFPNVDYGEGTMTIVAANNAGYDWSGPLLTPGQNFIDYSMNPARRIPLHGLVYHDVHVATWYTGDGVSKVPSFWNVKDLFNILYASMPLFMPPSASFWNENRDKFLTSYFLDCSVFREAGFARMTEHRMLSDDRQVQQSHFDNGWTVTANFGVSGFTIEGRTLPEYGFFATDGNREVFRIKRQNKTLSVSRLDDRLFINPSGSDQEFRGVRTRGSVLIKKESDHLHLATIGEQDYIDMHPDSIPWPMSVSRVSVENQSAGLQTEALDGGWMRIRKTGTKRFYSVFGAFKAAPDGSGGREADPGFGVNPNPFHDAVRFSYTLRRNAAVRLSLYNVRGERVAVLADGSQDAGSRQFQYDMVGRSAGVYLGRLEVDGKTYIRKMLLIR
jgi:hypothetical protein